MAGPAPAVGRTTQRKNLKMTSKYSPSLRAAQKIIVTCLSIDGVRRSRTFKTLAGAQALAHDWVGEHPSIGTGYAVSDDGVTKVTVRGAALADIFPQGDNLQDLLTECSDAAGSADWFDEAGERAWQDNAKQQRDRILDTARRETGCSCSEQQLNLVGCDCRNWADLPF